MDELKLDLTASADSVFDFGGIFVSIWRTNLLLIVRILFFLLQIIDN